MLFIIVLALCATATLQSKAKEKSPSEPTHLKISSVTESADTFVGYDCSQVEPSKTIGPISLMDPISCKLKNPSINLTREYIRIIQISAQKRVLVNQCLVKYTRKISRCGWWIENVIHGLKTGIVTLTPNECLSLHMNNSLTVRGKQLEDLKPTFRNTRNFIQVGDLDGKGGCTGGEDQIIDGVMYNNPIVEWTIEVHYSRVYIDIDYKTNTVYTPGRVDCVYTDQTCFSDRGQIFWDRSEIEKESCSGNQYTTLYEGFSNISDTQDRRVLLVENQNITFAMDLRSESSSICGYPATSTNFPDTFVLFHAPGKTFPVIKTEMSLTKQLITFLLSRDIFLEKKIDNTFRDLQSYLQQRKCISEKKEIKNILFTYRNDPFTMAYLINKRRGLTSVVSGEVVYFKPCKPILVSIMETPKCYREIPVTFNNRSGFLLPLTRVFSRVGTEIYCDKDLRPMFKTGGGWINIYKGYHISKSPIQLEQRSSNNWQYKSSSSMSKVKGIMSFSYSKVLSYPSEKLPFVPTSDGTNTPGGLNQELIYSSDSEMDVQAHISRWIFSAWISHVIDTIGHWFLMIGGLYFLFKCISFLFGIYSRFKILTELGKKPSLTNCLLTSQTMREVVPKQVVLEL
ncbi:MAG: hypothetical protein FCPXV1_gp3 [Hangzhou cletus punctiger xinmovirus 1]|uniref:Glycoprotein n=1 Tax=Hangzhou cletus punctiger xinmovirus 1 TaxID=2905556 RepID=A0A8K1XCH1_9MONO|nr:MAG: hypothetical protein FCPXV1_gp3 [Hangzhou cletus punctiger xinmovirus 1]